MRRKAKELQQKRKEEMRGGRGRNQGYMGSGFGNNSMGRQDSPVIDTGEPSKPAYTPPR